MHVIKDTTTTLGPGSVSFSVGEGLMLGTKTTSGRKSNVNECANLEIFKTDAEVLE